MEAKNPLWSADCRVSASSAQTALNRLLSEDRLKLSERNRRFLTFVVTEALADRGSRIKAYTIGVDVFGRGADFDPSNDPIVRIEATRIRSALAAYYEKFGGEEPVRIIMPPGAYVPIFEANESVELRKDDGVAAESAAPSADVASRPTILVTARAAPHDRSGGTLVELLKQSIAVRLRTMKLRVFLSPSPERKATTRAIKQLLLHPVSAYALDLAVHSTAEGQRQSWALVDLSTGELLNLMLENGTGRGARAIDEPVQKAADMIERALRLS